MAGLVEFIDSDGDFVGTDPVTFAPYPFYKSYKLGTYFISHISDKHSLKKRSGGLHKISAVSSRHASTLPFTPQKQK